MNSKARKHLQSLRRRRDLLETRVATYAGGDPHPTRRELRALIWALERLDADQARVDFDEEQFERLMDKVMVACREHESAPSEESNHHRLLQRVDEARAALLKYVRSIS